MGLRDNATESADGSVRHHELCFGCGRTNLFGLMLEARRATPDGITASCFVKQDHQGPVPGRAHPGIIACALLEVMLLAAGPDVAPARVEVEPEPGASVAVGCFVDLSASLVRRGDASVAAHAVATVDGQIVARAAAQFHSSVGVAET